ncbi:hypothetical protein [Parabacteroides sp. PF5-6]|uniref:hypothetical protein n=1 Tax=Parabacteroides sp. PF5-6 TaxID=1742403 RepID=UPI002405D069|nr:hypothetical protein [Parabacteroides sp. PF5-6]MDF9829153.1 hypothetical protein [Parabacteroides sp. PF5-6]
MKLKLLFLFLLCAAFSYGQNETFPVKKGVEPYSRYWLMQTSFGANIDLVRSSSDPYAALLATRPEVAPVWAMRLTHLFSRRLGWYANLQMSFYKERKSEYLDPDLLEEVFEGLVGTLFWPVSRMRPSAHAGLVYRLESNRWKIYPALGVGYGCYLPDRDKEKNGQDEDGRPISFVYKQHASSFSLNLGLSAHYFMNERYFLVFNADYQQPLQKSYARLTTLTQGEEPHRANYQTTTAGRTLNLHLGIGLIFGQ